MLYETIFKHDFNLSANEIEQKIETSQPLVQLHLHYKLSLKLIQCNISMRILNTVTADWYQSVARKDDAYDHNSFNKDIIPLSFAPVKINLLYCTF